jgi:hypothetical protein
VIDLLEEEDPENDDGENDIPTHLKRMNGKYYCEICNKYSDMVSVCQDSARWHCSGCLEEWSGLKVVKLSAESEDFTATDAIIKKRPVCWYCEEDLAYGETISVVCCVCRQTNKKEREKENPGMVKPGDLDEQVDGLANFLMHNDLRGTENAGACVIAQIRLREFMNWKARAKIICAKGADELFELRRHSTHRDEAGVANRELRALAEEETA